MAGALNLGLAHVRGDFIARLAADDRMAPGRLARQLAALRARQDLIGVGSVMTIIDVADRPLGRTRPRLDPDEIAAAVWFGNPLPHPSLLLRRYALRDGYPVIIGCEDWAAWLRLTARARVANLPEQLTDYRVTPGSASRRPLERDALESCLAVGFAARGLPEDWSRPWAALLRGERPDGEDPLEIGAAILRTLTPPASASFSRYFSPALARLPGEDGAADTTAPDSSAERGDVG